MLEMMAAVLTIKRHNGQAGHFGLIGMRERAEQIGGTLSIHSSEGSGTEVVADAPISEK